MANEVTPSWIETVGLGKGVAVVMKGGVGVEWKEKVERLRREVTSGKGTVVGGGV